MDLSKIKLDALADKLKYQHEYAKLGGLVARLTKLVRDLFLHVLTFNKPGDEIIKKDYKFKKVWLDFDHVSKLLQEPMRLPNGKLDKGKMRKTDGYKQLQKLLDVKSDPFHKIKLCQERFGACLTTGHRAVIQNLENGENVDKFIFDVLLSSEARHEARLWYLDELMRFKTLGDFLKVIQAWLNSNIVDHPFDDLLESDIEEIKVNPTAQS